MADGKRGRLSWEGAEQRDHTQPDRLEVILVRVTEWQLLARQIEKLTEYNVPILEGRVGS